MPPLLIDKLKTFLASKSSQPSVECAQIKRRGDDCLRNGDLTEAIACYRHAIDRCPQHAEACLALGFALSEAGTLAEAERCLQRALELAPGLADAHYVLGTIAQRTGDAGSAAQHFRHAIEIAPGLEHAHRDLQTLLLEQQRTGEAREAAESAIRQFPESAEFHFRLAGIDFLEKRLDHAIDRYRHALSLQPDAVAAWINLGRALCEVGKIDEAISCQAKAAALAPGDASIQVELGNLHLQYGAADAAFLCFQEAARLDSQCVAAYQSMGYIHTKRSEMKEARACFEHVVRIEPDNPMRHLVAALAGDVTESAPQEYVERLFDEYAETFDTHLTGSLGYSVPQQLQRILKPILDNEKQRLAVLDLGCGTGLFGAEIASLAGELVGVDLSSKMLDKARERGLYARLEHKDLLEMERAEANAHYDLIAAADVLVYIGALDQLVSETRRILRPGGWFAFSVESLDAVDRTTPPSGDLKDYRLNPTGRYAHSISYLTRLAANNGFEELHLSETQTRLDRGRPIIGNLVVWRRK